MYDRYNDSDDMLMMDHLDEAYEKGLDIWEYSTFEELQNALHEAPDSYGNSTSCNSYTSCSSTSSYQKSTPVSAAPKAQKSYTPYTPSKPEPPSVGIFFMIYMTFMTFLILGSLCGLIFYDRAESWWDWAVEIFCIIFLYLLPIWLKVNWYRDDEKRYRQKVERYEEITRSNKTK